MLNLVDIIIILVLFLCVGGALWYIRKEKKRGVKCIGCPAAGTCPSQKKSMCSSNADKTI